MTTQNQRTATELQMIDGPKKIGPYEVHTIEAGKFGLDGGAMFGIVPKTIWDKTNPADELNRIEMHLRCLLLIERDNAGNKKRVILVDNGIGTKWADKFLQIYNIDHSKWSLDQELAKKGVRPEEVTDLIASHLHFDHMGGTTRKIKTSAGKEELIPTFPNAKFWVHDQNWDLAYHPNEKDRASYLKENYDLYSNDSRLQLVYTQYGAKEKILPGIFAKISNGHTRGMMCIEVSDDQNSLLYCADAIPTATHVRVPFIMGYDCYPLTMIEEKKKWLKEAEERNTILFLEHCPRAHGVSILHDGKDFAVKQAYRF